MAELIPRLRCLAVLLQQLNAQTACEAVNEAIELLEEHWLRHFVVEIESDPPFPYGVAVVTASDGQQSTHVHGDDPVLWHFLNAIAAAPKLAGGEE